MLSKRTITMIRGNMQVASDNLVVCGLLVEFASLLTTTTRKCYFHLLNDTCLEELERYCIVCVAIVMHLVILSQHDAGHATKP
jgi:hypothetical protein